MNYADMITTLRALARDLETVSGRVEITDDSANLVQHAINARTIADEIEVVQRRDEWVAAAVAEPTRPSAGREFPFELLDSRGFVLSRYSDENAAEHHRNVDPNHRHVAKSRGERGWAGRSHGTNCWCPAWHLSADGNVVYTNAVSHGALRRWWARQRPDEDAGGSLRWFIGSDLDRAERGRRFNLLDYALAHIEAQL